MRRGDEPLITWNDDTIKDLRPHESAIPQHSRYYTIRAGDMLDLIAYKFYGDEALWYLIADVNEIMDVMEPLEPGMRLAIPVL